MKGRREFGRPASAPGQYLPAGPRGAEDQLAMRGKRRRESLMVASGAGAVLAGLRQASLRNLELQWFWQPWHNHQPDTEFLKAGGTRAAVLQATGALPGPTQHTHTALPGCPATRLVRERLLVPEPEMSVAADQSIYRRDLAETVLCPGARRLLARLQDKSRLLERLPQLPGGRPPRPLSLSPPREDGTLLATKLASTSGHVALPSERLGQFKAELAVEAMKLFPSNELVWNEEDLEADLLQDVEEVDINRDIEKVQMIPVRTKVVQDEVPRIGLHVAESIVSELVEDICKRKIKSSSKINRSVAEFPPPPNDNTIQSTAIICREERMLGNSPSRGKDTTSPDLIVSTTPKEEVWLTFPPEATVCHDEVSLQVEKDVKIVRLSESSSSSPNPVKTETISTVPKETAKHTSFMAASIAVSSEDAPERDCLPSNYQTVQREEDICVRSHSNRNGSEIAPVKAIKEILGKDTATTTTIIATTTVTTTTTTATRSYVRAVSPTVASGRLVTEFTCAQFLLPELLSWSQYRARLVAELLYRPPRRRSRPACRDLQVPPSRPGTDTRRRRQDAYRELPSITRNVNLTAPPPSVSPVTPPGPVVLVQDWLLEEELLVTGLEQQAGLEVCELPRLPHLPDLLLGPRTGVVLHLPGRPEPVPPPASFYATNCRSLCQLWFVAVGPLGGEAAAWYSACCQVHHWTQRVTTGNCQAVALLLPSSSPLPALLARLPHYSANLKPDMTRHELFLVNLLPSLNPYSARLILSSCSLLQFLALPAPAMQDLFPWLPHSEVDRIVSVTHRHFQL